MSSPLALGLADAFMIGPDVFHDCVERHVVGGSDDVYISLRAVEDVVRRRFGDTKDIPTSFKK